MYAAVTRRREESPPGKSSSIAGPGVKTYVDALAALVPAEVLSVHAATLTFTTKTDSTTLSTTITDAGTLRWVFWALLVLGAAIYVIAKLYPESTWDKWDYARVLIPPLAFCGWTMLQKATAFDAVFPEMPSGTRSAIAIIGAVVLGLAASALAYKADAKPVHIEPKPTL
jgi:hypothetical protein